MYMVVPITIPMPVVNQSSIKYNIARMMNKIVFTIMMKIVHNIHGTSSIGFSCKEKKPIAILNLFCYGVAKIFLHHIQ
jgi:hypothetical protein